MLNILRKSLATGVVTTAYPEAPPAVAPNARGRPNIDYASWKDARIGAAACPTGAIACEDGGGERTATLDLGKCIMCGLCAEADPVSIRMTPHCELSARRRDELKTVARYTLDSDGSHRAFVEVSNAATQRTNAAAIESTGHELRQRIAKMFGRSLHIREVDAGSCNGCEVEINALNSPVYDIERFGVHFVASPRHADMLLVTGPVTRNMEMPLRKTYEAMPAPRLVVAVGACGCSAGIFGTNYATIGAVDKVIPVDVYVPGCPPNPHALLHGILLAIGRMPTHA